jgi:pyruvate formate lyase activating enzyme
MVLEKKGLIFDIQKFSLQDGPGIRTIVFMKGCPLRCKWCHNPESQANYPEIAYYPNNCIYCRECVKACPEHSIIEVRNKIRIDRSFCKECQSKPCVEACNFEAIKLIGRYVTVQELMKELKKDDVFYRMSDGGITISGGEPLYQADFVRDLLKELKKKNYHTSIETCSFCPWEQFQKVIDYTDLFLCDIKNMDQKNHLKGTGVKNFLILDNIMKLSRVAKKVIIRIPVIPKFNDNDQNMKQIIDFALKNSIDEIHLLPYHDYGASKYKAIGRKYNLHDRKSPQKSQLDHFKKLIEFHHVQCKIVA